MSGEPGIPGESGRTGKPGDDGIPGPMGPPGVPVSGGGGEGGGREGKMERGMEGEREGTEVGRKEIISLALVMGGVSGDHSIFITLFRVQRGFQAAMESLVYQEVK